MNVQGDMNVKYTYKNFEACGWLFCHCLRILHNHSILKPWKNISYLDGQNLLRRMKNTSYHSTFCENQFTNSCYRGVAIIPLVTPQTNTSFLAHVDITRAHLRNSYLENKWLKTKLDWTKWKIKNADENIIQFL